MQSYGTDMKVASVAAEPLEDFPVEDPYRAWLAREGVPVIEGYAFADLKRVDLAPWPRKGGSGAVINIPYHHVANDAQIVEIAPGGTSEPEHHLYEETTYVVSGQGTTTIWVEGGEKHTFEWAAGALFSIPVNAWYQHYNASGSAPTRYLSMTNAPPIMRLFGDDEAVFGTNASFKKRFSGESDYFSGEGRLYKRRVWQSNFVPNAPDMALWGWRERGAGGTNVRFEMAGNNTKTHISEFPVGTYKKAHRHGPGAHLVILSGQGFSLLWTKEDMSDVEKVDWSKDSMVIVPRDDCFHQHFNTGTTRARYLAMLGGSMGLTVPVGRGMNGTDVSIREGGIQVEYEDEARTVHAMFEEDLRRHGARCLMKAFVPWCTGEVGPTDERLT